MQVGSYVFALYKKMLQKVVKSPTCSQESPYTNISHFHIEHRLNWLPLIGYTKCACIEVVAEP